ncbi:hypothetical protein KCG44_11325 [Pacificimonas sp. WHA3]|uniref:N,N-dimethylformamidase beta subunit-like C-terminal domain-containing protein n=1 Tax=Pacificimonas pallii TaxID=2827236 RepID=A0ABS6SGA6_9SPHN|nr:N,N-dimethylformamidase beta subunit family domain-containing protein [Pacificimonas pallii]MBV7257376.1 hypothetical protein [Pacificimonas pallii]
MTKTIVGYADRLSVRAGDKIAFHASAYGSGTTDVSLVRLTGCDDPDDGGIFEETEVPAAWAGRIEVPHQPIFAGSYAAAEGVRAISRDGGVHLALFVWQNEHVNHRQCLVSIGNSASGARLELCLEDKVPQLICGDAMVSGTAISPRRWTLLLIDVDGGGQATIRQCPAPQHGLEMREANGSLVEGWGTFSGAAGRGARASHLECWFGAANRDGRPALAFDGKLEQPAFFDRALSDSEAGLYGNTAPEAHAGLPCNHIWDFGSDIASETAVDRGPASRHCRIVNLPTRAACGRKWDGTVHDWTVDSSHYGALHFHSNAIADAEWKPFATWTVPADLPSGLYAAKLVQGESDDYVPFYILPQLDAAKSAIAFLAPTASYLAYANFCIQPQFAPLYPQMREDVDGDALLRAHPEFGGGLYDMHPDGSGVHYSSLHRPIVNFRPKASNWAFTADGDIIAWLEQTGETYDTITDDALHREGIDLLDGYQVIVTGTHPEYWSTTMMEALEAWLARGGRLMYMGGNGFYWRIAFDPNGTDCIEVRRAEDGTRAWLAEPGEYYHSFSGELGGLWRRLGRTPQSLVGVGFSAQGFGGSTHYRLTEAAADPRAAFILDGVESEVIGDFGAHGDGAAGEEIDRADFALGTPPHALVIASSEKHNALMLRAKEELLQTMPPGIEDPEVRADMVFFETASGGAVWSTGSIAWAGSLAHNDYDNNVARISTNVLRHFAKAETFRLP